MGKHASREGNSYEIALKKFIIRPLSRFLCFFLIIVSSCSKLFDNRADDGVTGQTSVDITVSSDGKISADDASKIASVHLNAGLVSGYSSPLEVVSCDAYVEEGDTLLYLINFNDSRGYAVVSSDIESEDLVFAYAYQGNSSFSQWDDPISQGLLESYVSVVRQCRETKSGLFTKSGIQNIEVDFLSGNECKTPHWGQFEPYNSLIQKIDGEYPPTGCVATALAQIMGYWKHPDFYGDSCYDWAAVKKDPDNITSEDAIRTVAQLMVDIGNEVHMKYTLDASSAPTTNVPTALKEFGYLEAQLNSGFDEELVISEICSGRPIYMSGSRTEETYHGHAFVIEGYQQKETKNEDNKKDSYYYLVNLGWNEYRDGKFSDSAGSKYTLLSDFKYRYEIKTVTNITPTEVELSFDANGGNLYSTEKHDVCAGSITLLPDVRKDNTELVGWFDERGNNVGQPGDEYRVTGAATLYAIWEDGNAQAIELSKKTLDFGDVEIGSTESKKLSITNNSEYTVSIKLNLSYPFSISGDTDKYQLEAGQTVKVKICFTPEEETEYEGILTISCGGERYQVVLEGSGISSEEDFIPDIYPYQGYSSNDGKIKGPFTKNGKTYHGGVVKMLCDDYDPRTRELSFKIFKSDFGSFQQKGKAYLRLCDLSRNGFSGSFEELASKSYSKGDDCIDIVFKLDDPKDTYVIMGFCEGTDVTGYYYTYPVYVNDN